MIKTKKILILSFSCITNSALTLLPIISCSSSNNAIPKINLSNQEVIKNFSANGIWFEKTSLSYEDFNNYNSIDLDSFDNINVELDFIELPSNLILNSSNQSITWKNIKQIKIKDLNNDNLKIINDILFSLEDESNKTFIALTICDRINNISIKFPNENQVPKKHYYKIADNFYNEEIFKNVNQISFDEEKFTPLIYIGESAFKNCFKLSSYIEINLVVPLINKISLDIMQDAFNNTSIEDFYIDALGSANDYLFFAEIDITIGENSFANNEKLNTFKIDAINSALNQVILKKESFINNSKLSTFTVRSPYINIQNKVFINNDDEKTRLYFFITKNIYFNNEVFVGKYKRFFLYFDFFYYPGTTTENNSLSLSSNTFSNIKCDNSNFDILITKKSEISKNLFDNVGLSNDQKNKVQTDYEN